MSWCRWGSLCDATFPYNYKVNEECKDCPGSDVYIFESATDGKFECCDCGLANSDSDFRAGTAAEMLEHILKHEAAGHHVRRSLVAEARGEKLELTDSCVAFMKRLWGSGWEYER